jgi:FtsP/CotA-like multicopper oxidase with cupredoxin domain
MDGVPYLTQCPVPFGESFRYSFRVEDEGTHLYHSHAGNQKTDGAFGALVVRGFKDENPNAWTYDYDLPDYTIIMNDWMHQSADDHMPGYEKRSLLSQSVLINGHGRFYNVRNETVRLFVRQFMNKVVHDFLSKQLKLRRKLR